MGYPLMKDCFECLRLAAFLNTANSFMNLKDGASWNPNRHDVPRISNPRSQNNEINPPQTSSINNFQWQFAARSDIEETAHLRRLSYRSFPLWTSAMRNVWPEDEHKFSAASISGQFSEPNGVMTKIVEVSTR
jgi:hypothetical protein